jgi:hypothetical protein
MQLWIVGVEISTRTIHNCICISVYFSDTTWW